MFVGYSSRLYGAIIPKMQKSTPPSKKCTSSAEKDFDGRGDLVNPFISFRALFYSSELSNQTIEPQASPLRVYEITT